MPDTGSSAEITLASLPELLKDDTKVKVAGVDIDGILRGKLMAKKKFLSVAKDGFGFCSVIFGWDMHDQTYFKELKISNKENGYRDVIAVPDLSSFRRIPWEHDIPFFLVSFLDPDTHQAISACPRSLLKTAVDKLEAQGLSAMAGGKLVRAAIFHTDKVGRCLLTFTSANGLFFTTAEYEFFQFRPPSNSNAPTSERNSSATATFLKEHPVNALPPLTEGMFGYSLTRPVHNQDYYYGIFEACEKFRCGIEGWHTESGPGVFEAVCT